MSRYDELFEGACEVIRDSKLAPHAAEIEAALLPAISVSTESAPDDEIAVGSSKIGGVPDAPRHFAWPFFRDEPLSFIAQFRLDEIAPFDCDQILPNSGVLAFFSALRPPGAINDLPMHGDIGVAEHTRGAWRVLHFEDARKLQRATFPTQDRNRIYESCAVSGLCNLVSPPDDCALEMESLFRDQDGVATDEWEEYLELQREIKSVNPDWNGCHSLLGNGFFYQDDERFNAERFAREIGCDVELSPQQCRDVTRAATRWRLLLQLSSSDDMSWAGDGYGYFFSTHDALKARQFQQAYFGLQR